MWFEIDVHYYYGIMNKSKVVHMHYISLKCFPRAGIFSGIDSFGWAYYNVSKYLNFYMSWEQKITMKTKLN